MGDKERQVENDIKRRASIVIQDSTAQIESGVSVTPSLAGGDSAKNPNPGELIFTKEEDKVEREKKRAAEEAAKDATQGAEYAQRLWDYVNKRDPNFPKAFAGARGAGVNLSCSFAHSSRVQRFKNWCGTPPNQPTIEEVDLIIRARPKEGKWNKFLDFVFGDNERVKIVKEKDGKIHVEALFVGDHPSIQGTVDACRVLATKEQEMVIATKMKEKYGDQVLKDPNFNFEKAREEIIKEMPEALKKEIFSFEINKLNTSQELEEMLGYMKKDPTLYPQLSDELYNDLAAGKKGPTNNLPQVQALLKKEGERRGIKPDADADNTLKPKPGEDEGASKFTPR